MHSSCCPCARLQTLKVLFVRVCLFYAMTLAGWPLSEAARLRCGSDLLSDLLFVCGERGIYVGKGTWSGYGARPRGKGIVDLCCRPAGCELQHLEMYCAKPKSQQPTTANPVTTIAYPATTQPNLVGSAQQFQAVFHKRLLEHLGAPNSPKREANRKKSQPSPQRKKKNPSTRRKANLTSGPPSASRSPLQSVMTSES
uniref:Insulin-like domain-containing protein n=1 Tax=Mola mola TaxID=94237 RepID=A0A3Q3XPI6_MOLML